MIYPRTT